MNKENVIICDIDGCVLDTSWIENKIAELGLTRQQGFAYFDAHIEDREPVTITKMRDFLRMFDNKSRIIFVTARNEKLREITYRQLTSALGMFPEVIYMRPEGNLDEPYILKEKILEEINNHFNVILAIDDNGLTCRMYEQYGILTIACNTPMLLAYQNKKEDELAWELQTTKQHFLKQ